MYQKYLKSFTRLDLQEQHIFSLPVDADGLVLEHQGVISYSTGRNLTVPSSYLCI